MASTANRTLNTFTLLQPDATINTLRIMLQFTAILALLYYRVKNLFFGNGVPTLPWAVMTTAELILTFYWILEQAFRLRPIVCSVFPENIPSGIKLPGVDVFICCCDPEKEPVVDVMNTVISALALDYPPEKLGVYLSDDGGSAITLFAIRETCSFAKSWLPFCKKYGIKTRTPKAYFSSSDDEGLTRNEEFRKEEGEMKSKYQLLEESIQKAGEKGISSCVSPDRLPCVQLIHDSRNNGDNCENDAEMPLLVYVSRERRPHRPHHFKAGALNTLLRISGIISNAPYILMLDCDMFCNDPTSATQAMCFFLDPQMSGSLAFVQFPQLFHNTSKNDIYDGQLRCAFKIMFQGLNGLRGPLLSGSGCYIRRRALFGNPDQEELHFDEPQKIFGSSIHFINSLRGKNEQSLITKCDSSDAILQEARCLASCAYETNTKWGKEVGFLYESLLESTFSGYLLHCKGWISAYLYPKRSCFLGSQAIGMKDAMAQMTKFYSAFLQIALSRFSPLIYGMSKMSILQSMCYGFITFSPLNFFGIALYGTVPQLCFLGGIPVFPKVTSPWFAVFSVVYVLSHCQHLLDVLSTGGTVRIWWNEQRVYVMRGISGSLFGGLDGLMNLLGIQKAKFRLTNKAISAEAIKRYEKDEYDFQEAAIFVLPLAILAMLNMVCFLGGLTRAIFIDKTLGQMFGQFYLSFFFLILSYPILEGIVTTKSKAKGDL